MRLPHIPRPQQHATKPTRPVLHFDLDFPLLAPEISNLIPQRGVVEVLDVLAEMIGPVECALLFIFGHAFDDAVRLLEMLLRGVRQHAEGAHFGVVGGRGRGGDGNAGSRAETGPFAVGVVLGFFVAAPGFGRDGLVAEGTLPGLLGLVVG